MANKVTINTDALGITWSQGATYRVAIDEGFIKEDGGEGANNEANNNFYSFTTNSSGPTFTTSTPAPNATGFVDSVILIQYNRFIRKNTGNIYLYKLTGNTLVSTVSVNDTKVSISDDIMAVDFSGLIWDPVAEYYVLTDAAIVKDYDGFSAAAISNTGTLRFTTGVAPVIVSTSPANGATTVTNTTSMTFTFDANMAPYATGYIKLYDGNNNLINQFNVAGGNVAYSGNTVTVNCTGYLTKGNTEYYWLIDSNVLASTGGFLFGGVSSTSAYRYTTKAFPTITYSPTDNATGVTNNSFVKMSFSEAVTTSSAKYIKLYEAGTNTLKTTIEATDGSYVAINGLSCYIDLTGYLKSNKEYYITVDAGAFKTSAGIENNAITAGTWNFTMDYLLKFQYQVQQSTYNYYATPESSPWMLGANGSYFYTGDSNSFQVRSISTGSVLRTITGRFLAAEGTNVLVGDPYYNDGIVNSGRAYLYNASTGSLIRTFTNPNLDTTTTGSGEPGDLFGEYGGISGSLAAISASWANSSSTTNTGYVYIFNISTGAVVSTLASPDPTDTESYFGTAISMNSNYITVGQYLNDIGATTSAGAVYMYATGSGSTSPLRSFPNPTPQTGDGVGLYLASSSQYSIIGAAGGSTGTDYGKVYVYNSDTGTYNTLTNPINSSTSYLGKNLTANSQYFLVGTSDAVYMYKTDTRTLFKTLYLDGIKGPIAASEDYYLIAADYGIPDNNSNLLYYSSSFSSGTPGWAVSYGSLTTGISVAGGAVGKTMNEVVSNNGGCYISQTLSSSARAEQYNEINNAESITYSIYAKAGTGNFINLLISLTSGYEIGASFNLSDGTTQVASDSGVTLVRSLSASMTNLGGGWYRCNLILRKDLTSSQKISLVAAFMGRQHMNPTNPTAYLQYQVTGTGLTVYIGQIQLNTGTSATSFQSTTTAINVPTTTSGPYVIAYKEDV